MAFFFVYDFFYYWFHRLQHRWPFLWAQHKLHHSEEALNATTTFRHHWLEDLLRVFLIVLPMSMAFDLKPASAGAAAFVVGLWPGIHPRKLAAASRAASRGRRGTAGPSHPPFASSPAHLDRNLAAFFPLWDQLFGTYYHPRRADYPRTGLASGQKVTSLRQALWLPFGEVARARTPARRSQAPRGASRSPPGVSPSCWVSRLLEVAARIVFPLPAIGNFNRIEYALTAISPSMRNKHYLMNSTLAWTSSPITRARRCTSTSTAFATGMGRPAQARAPDPVRRRQLRRGLHGCRRGDDSGGVRAPRPRGGQTVRSVQPAVRRRWPLRIT